MKSFDLFKGKNPKNRRLFDPSTKNLGWWIRADLDTIRSLQQQYRP